eukprot:scaffold15567_cov74-Skeletonema_dohrnii-CCMP3373.AAC.1
MGQGFWPGPVVLVCMAFMRGKAGKAEGALQRNLSAPREAIEKEVDDEMTRMNEGGRAMKMIMVRMLIRWGRLMRVESINLITYIVILTCGM